MSIMLKSMPNYSLSLVVLFLKCTVIHCITVHVKWMTAVFKAIVMVLQGTNQPLPDGFKATNKMIVKQNKFQMAHAVRKDKIAQGILPGVKGKLIDIKPIQK